jgi:hypothetical protein
LSEIMELEETPGRFKAKRIDKGGLLCANHTRPLNSIKAVVSEQARVYRAMVNSVITLNEGIKLVYVLREIRSSLEALNVETAAAVTNAPVQPPAPLQINIVTVPSGHFLTAEQAAADYKWEGELTKIETTIEHQAAPEETSTAAPAPEPDRFACMTIDELKRMAGVDVDPQ